MFGGFGWNPFLSMYSATFQFHVFNLVAAKLALLDDKVRECYHERMARTKAGTALGKTIKPNIIESIVDSNGETGTLFLLFRTGRSPNQLAVAFNDLIDLTSCNPERSQPGECFAIHQNMRPDGGTDDAHDRIPFF